MKTPWSDSAWRRVLVYGLGLSGRAASRLLLSRGVEVVAVDARPPERLEIGDLRGRAGFAVLSRQGAGEGESCEPEELPKGADAVDAVVLSPGVPGDRPLLVAARAAGLPIVAEVELAQEFLDAPMVGITGSNGKSTTTKMTGSVLAADGYDAIVCGNIGVPLSAALADAGPADPTRPRVYVVELSSFQLETVDRLAPKAAALLNISPDHMDRYDGLEDYADAKRRIFARQGPDDVAVLNADDPVSAATEVTARRRTFSRRGPVEDGCHLDGGMIVEVAPGAEPVELLAVDELPLPGVHNVENAMVAALLARAVGAGPEAVRRGLMQFEGLPHRLQKVAEAGGVVWYDDSKGTNPAATLGSLAGMNDGTVHLILGGSEKDSDFGELTDAVVAKAKRVYLIGETARKIEAALAPALTEHGIPFEQAGTLDAAVDSAAGQVEAGDVVLLSPACASFDQFRDFVHRGEEFHRLVESAISGGRTA